MRGEPRRTEARPTVGGCLRVGDGRLSAAPSQPPRAGGWTTSSRARIVAAKPSRRAPADSASAWPRQWPQVEPPAELSRPCAAALQCLLPSLTGLVEDRQPVALRIVRALDGESGARLNQDLDAVFRLVNPGDEGVLEDAHHVADG